jgi:hypothetical protein
LGEAGSSPRVSEEMSALSGFDILRYKPELVCIEVDHSSTDAIVAYFNKAGYRRLDEYLPPVDTHNLCFAPK